MKFHTRPAILVAVGFVVGLSLYLYSSVHGQLLLLGINQTIETYNRAQHWNWKPTPEEAFCRSAQHFAEKRPIPDVVHFVLVSNDGQRSELSYAHFLSIKTALARMNASAIKLHTFDLDTDNEWWRQVQDRVTLVRMDRDEIVPPHGLLLSELSLAHQADVIRLDIIQREGGIYLDLDVYTLKPFTDLLGNERDMLLGHEGANRYGLCNAVIIARPDSDFIALWRDSYKTFNPKKWNEHSVLKPKQLQVAHPSLVCPLAPTVFFWPFWEKWNVAYMHDPIGPAEAAELRANMTAYGGSMYEDQLAYHSWAGKDYLSKLTPESVLTTDTRFNILMRDVAAAPL